MPKEIVLTFDDSPGPATGALLDVLQPLGIKAILFCIGVDLEHERSVAERAVAEGHVLGNHSYGHAWYSTLGIPQIIADIDRADLLIEETYRSVGVSQSIKAFRYPFGDKGTGNSRYKLPLRRFSRRFLTAQRHLKECGYIAPGLERVGMHAPLRWCRDDIDWSWTCDLKEFTQRSWTAVWQDLAAILERPGRDILLLHDHAETHDTVCRVLHVMAAHGVSFVDPDSAIR